MCLINQILLKNFELYNIIYKKFKNTIKNNLNK